MTDQLPSVEVEDDDVDYAKRARSMANKLVSMVNGYAGDRNRVRSLVLFEERANGTSLVGARPIGKVAYGDRPEIELILYHRDQVLRLDKALRACEAIVETFNRSDEVLPPDEWKHFSEALKQLTKLDAQRLMQTRALEDLLAGLTAELAGAEKIMANLAADAASLSQKATEHRDKMELANKSAAIPSSLELKQRLALKYNVPIDQVDAILGAKSVEADPPDDG